jgi:hypothetical protein
MPLQTSIDKKSPEHKDKVYATFVKKIGGREGLKTLAHSSSDPRATKLLALLSDGARLSWGVKKLAQAAGLSLLDLREMLYSAHTAEALDAAFESLPDIVREAAYDAKGNVDLCERCDGLGQLELKKGMTHPKTISFTDDGRAVITCPKCKGNGEARVKPDKDARDFIGEATKLTGGKGTNINVNTQINTAALQSFEELMKKSQSVEIVNQRKTDVIEAEVVNED